MRFKLVLERKSESGRVVTLNYHKYIASWIYQTIYAANPFMAEKMQHDFSCNKSLYKLFTFSMLHTGQKTNVDNQRMLVLDDELTLTVSFYDQTYASLFREGLQYNRELLVGDARNHLYLMVKRVELPMDPWFTDSMVFRTSSPIALGIQYGGYTEMLHPTDEMYGFMIFRDLLNKSSAYQKSRSITPMQMAIHPGWKFEVITKPQIHRFKFHPKYEAHKANVDAYHYTFRVEAPEELLRIGYYSGFGTHNAKGFGFVKVVHDSKDAYINQKSTRAFRKKRSSGA